MSYYIPKGLTFPEANSSHLKMDGWNMILSFWVVGLFSGAFAVSFRRWISGWELWNSCEVFGLCFVDFQNVHLIAVYYWSFSTFIIVYDHNILPSSNDLFVDTFFKKSFNFHGPPEPKLEPLRFQFFFTEALVPLHKLKFLGGFHQQLSYCMAWLGLFVVIFAF